MPKSPEKFQQAEGQNLEAKSENPSDWLTMYAVRQALGVHETILKREIEKYREEHSEWFEKRRTVNGVLREHYSPELIELVEKNLSEFKEKYSEWEIPIHLAESLSLKRQELKDIAEKYRKDHPEWFATFRYGKGPLIEHYAPELIEQIKQETGASGPPEGWMAPSAIYRAFNNSLRYQEILEMAEPYVKEHPEWSKSFKSRGVGGRTNYYSPELVEIIKTKIQEEKKKLEGVGLAPEGWMTRSGVQRLLGTDSRIVNPRIEKMREEHPDWFREFRAKVGEKFGPTWEYLSPELVQILTEQLESEGYKMGRREKQLETDLENTLLKEADHFKKMISFFGAAQAVDILYINHPEYKSIPVGRVRSIIADYLGEFLVLRYEYKFEDFEDGLKYLGDQNLKNGLFEVMKNACLNYYHLEKKNNPERNDLEIIRSYCAISRSDMTRFESADLEKVIDKAEAYYESLFSDLKKPDNIVNSIEEEEREFPDINQLVNIKEIQDKKRMLIADEMGLGKSASVILAKEYLGLGQALAVVPSNVIETWKNYLSDKVADDGSQIGYFKPGQAPKVLVIEKIEDLKKLNVEFYDYILISQEKLTDAYTKQLATLDFDMLVVDEVHKLKNLGQGQRAQNIVELAQSAQGESKYLTLLSGTPAPNKVEDIATILKLLYPEKFEDMDNQEFVKAIIYGDLVDLRTLLVPRMQMKSLGENVEMPQLEQEIVLSELSEIEKDVYGVLLEEDEMTAPQKIRIMRQFLMNPNLLDATPGIEGTKIKDLRQQLHEEFQRNDKVVLFVNGYIEGVIRGDNSILKELNLPSDVEVMVIEGEVSKSRRIQIQKELKESKKRILLAVSGQTADVGVDFTGGEAVTFYNEPWTQYDKLQQLARVYRPGLEKDLTSRTFITHDTIEEGIHQYIEAKQRSIEKLLRGIPISELEKEMLEKTEKQRDPNLEVNPELAEYYFTSWDRLMKIFSEVKEIGEADFVQYLAEYGKDYAECYLDLGSRSYQANASRLTATIVNQFVKAEKKESQGSKILDIASGPEMLKRHAPEDLQERIISMDINQYHFAKPGENRVVGSFGKLPFKDNSLDYANLSLALHYTKYLLRKGEYERMEVLMEMNRVLKKGGKAVVNLIYSLDLKDEDQFKNLVEHLGFKIIDEFSGEVSVGNSYKSRVITLEKVKDVVVNVLDIVETLDRKTLEGLKLRNTDAGVRDSKKIFNKFTLAGKEYDVEFNADDKEVYEEEKKILEIGESLKKEFGAIEKIPRDTVIDTKFVRFFDGKQYILFKKLEKGRGVVVVK